MKDSANSIQVLVQLNSQTLADWIHVLSKTCAEARHVENPGFGVDINRTWSDRQRDFGLLI